MRIATMPCLLHVDASARTAASYSRRSSAAYAGAWRAVHPDGEVIRRDIGAEPVPFIDEAWTEVDELVVRDGWSDLDEIAAELSDPQHIASWAITRPLLEEVLAADTILIGTPMYNWSVPATLKAWLDHITFPFWRLDGTVVVVCTGRGGRYTPGTASAALDHQEPWLRTYFQRVGVTDITFVHSELTLAGVMPSFADHIDERDTSHANALVRAAELAAARPAIIPGCGVV